MTNPILDEAKLREILKVRYSPYDKETIAQINALAAEAVVEARLSELEMFKKVEVKYISKPVAAHISRRYAALLKQKETQ